MPQRCYEPPLYADGDPFTDGTCLAIGIYLSSPAHNQLHVGFLFKDKDNHPKFGHVGWHMECGFMDLPGEAPLYWVPLKIDHQNQQSAAWSLEAFLTLHQNKLPYSVESEGILFEDGVWKGTAPGQGLTCATFVTEYLLGLGFQILDTHNWKIRSGDEIWKAWVVDLLSKFEPAEHAAQQKARLGATCRIKPSDVASACSLYEDRMLTFDEVEPRSICITHTILNTKPCVVE